MPCPKSFFGAVDAKHHVPRNNVVFIGVIVLVGSFFLTFEQGIGLLNYGALIAFMGVNAAAFMHYFVRGRRRNYRTSCPRFWDSSSVLDCGGTSACRRDLGSIWMILGIAFGAWKTRWFREPLSFDAPPE